MAFFQGHPILADIRKGFKLRPTTTVDKSKPIIQADDEEVPTINYVKPDRPADLSYLYAKKDPDDVVVWRPRSIVPPPIIHKGKAMDGPIVHSRPTTPNPPLTNGQMKNPTLLKLGGAQQEVDRSALLNSIKGGIKLKKTVTKDRSGLILDEEYLEDIKNRSNNPSPTPMKMMSNDSPDMPNGVQPTNNYVPVEKPKESEPKTTKVRRKSSTTKAKVSTPTTPKNFVPAKAIGNAPPPPPPPPMASFVAAKPIGNAPPPPPPPPMSSGPLQAQNSVPKSSYTRSNNAIPPPPPVPPPLPPAMPQQQQSSYNSNPTPKPFSASRFEPKPEPIPESKKSDIVFDEKNLYITKESLEAEIKKGSASSRIALFKKFEQKDNFIPMPKSALPPIQTGKLKIIENKPKEVPIITAPITNGRLKIHENPTSPVTKKKEPETPLDVTATFTLPTRKYSVPITVKTDEVLPTTTTVKKVPKKLSNGKIKKSPKSKAAENTLSPNARCDSLSPNSATSSLAYQSGISSPNSISSISPKSKSSGISSTTSSVSPPLRTASINGSLKDPKVKEKSPPSSFLNSYNPKTSSVTAERFSKLRASFSEKVEEPTTTITLERPKKQLEKTESGEQFWKNAISKSNGVPTTPKAHQVEIKSPWSAKTSISNSSTSNSSTNSTPLKIAVKKPPAVPPKRTPISIKLANGYSSQNSNSYFDQIHDDPLNFRYRYKFDVNSLRECPVEIVQL